MAQNKLAILIDSTGDLPADLRKKHDIDYCQMRVNWTKKDGEEVDIPASLDYDAGYSAHEIYDVMRSGIRIFTTQVSDLVFDEKFEHYASKGYDVLYIACSSGLSASVKAGEKAAARVMEKHPGVKIICIDSLITGYAQGDMAIRARNMFNEGKTIDEIAAWLNKNRLRFNQFACVETLTYLKNAGRVSASSAFFGNLFKVKPILISDAKGMNFAVEKVKGRKAAILRVIDMAIDAIEDKDNGMFYIGHSDDEEGAAFCKEELLKKVPNAHTYTGPIGPIIGASTGPGIIAIYVFGKECLVNL